MQLNRERNLYTESRDVHLFQRDFSCIKVVLNFVILENGLDRIAERLAPSLGTCFSQYNARE